MNVLDPTKVLVSSTHGTHVYDLRNLSKRVFTEENHLGGVNACLWSPHRDYVYASCSNDRRLAIVDLGELDRYSINDLYNQEQSVIVTFDQAVQPRGTQEGST